MRQRLYGFTLHRLCSRNRIESHLTEIHGISLKAGRCIAKKIKPPKCLIEYYIRIFSFHLRGKQKITNHVVSILPPRVFSYLQQKENIDLLGTGSQCLVNNNYSISTCFESQGINDIDFIFFPPSLNLFFHIKSQVCIFLMSGWQLSKCGFCHQVILTEYTENTKLAIFYKKTNLTNPAEFKIGIFITRISSFYQLSD